MKRLSVVMISVVLVVAGSAGVDAGVEDEQVTTIGPVSGAIYQNRYSCAAGKLQTIFRTDTGRRNIMESSLSTDGPSANFVDRLSVSGFSLADHIMLTLKQNLADSWLIEEALEGAEPLVAVGPKVFVAGGRLDCPDYAAPTPSVFVPITPQRVLDTRPKSAINYSGPRPASASTTPIRRSVLPEIPVGAVAVSATVTVTEPSGPGFVQLLPAGSKPGGSSNVNPQHAGHTVANNAVSALSANGLSVYARQSTHLVVDINGYFVAAPNAAKSGRHQSLDSSLRIIDTRPATAINHTSGAVAGGRSLTIPVTTFAGLKQQPVAAVILNVTATQTRGPGYFQAAATGSLIPGKSSILNATREGDTVAAMTIVPVSADGSVDIHTSVDAHMVVDVLGWFTSDSAPASTVGRFVPLEPERILDTRIAGDPVNCCIANDGRREHDFTTGRALAGGRTTVEVDQIQMAGAESLMINVTAVDATSHGYFQVGPANGFVNGASSTVNAQGPGATVANSAIVGIATVVESDGNRREAFQIYTQNGGHLVADVAGYFTS